MQNNLKNSINFKKSLGQNFLFDLNLLNAIANDGLVSKDDIVLEIGTGSGIVAMYASKLTDKVTATDINFDAIEEYTEKLIRIYCST